MEHGPSEKSKFFKFLTFKSLNFAFLQNGANQINITFLEGLGRFVKIQAIHYLHMMVEWAELPSHRKLGLSSVEFVYSQCLPGFHSAVQKNVQPDYLETLNCPLGPKPQGCINQC